jgi:hypothetical protein
MAKVCHRAAEEPQWKRGKLLKKGCAIEPESTEFVELELHAKLLNGDLMFNEAQERVIKKWENRKFELLIEFVETILVPLHPLLKDSPEYCRLLKKVQLL